MLDVYYRFLLVLIFIFVYDLIFVEAQNHKMVESSKLIELIFEVKEEFKNRMPDSKPEWIMYRFDNLMMACEKPINTT